MKKVWCIVGQENVWANFQKEEAPVLLKYDLNNKLDWKPFLDNKLMKQFFPEKVQNSEETGVKILYQPPIGGLSVLEDQIKKYLAGKFEDERIA